MVPFKQYRNENLVPFDEWWEQQPFNLHFQDIEVTRAELIEAIRNKEGGGHVSPDTLKKIAAFRRARSGWHRSIAENDDGTTSMCVGVSLTRQPVEEGSDLEEISDYELAVVCAIAEEVLFSVTPEPENRKRMHDERIQGPFYLSEEAAEVERGKFRAFIAKLDALHDLERHQQGLVDSTKNHLEKNLEVNPFTSDDILRPEATVDLLKRLGVELS